MEIVVKSDGGICCVYSECIDLAAFGQSLITRASHVEPDCAGRWTADLALVDGPQLGPFARRSDALSAERRWLETHRLIRPDDPRLR